MAEEQLAVLMVRGNVVITQAEGGNYSHQGSLSVDFAYSKGNVPLYAPFDMTCKAVDIPNAFTVWQSDKKVKCADGSVSYVTFNTGHSNDVATNTVGKKRKKGEVYAYTGTAGNVTGDHTHIEASKGTFTSMWYTNSMGNGSLPNPSHLYDIFSSCDNVTGEKINITNQTTTPMPFKCILDWKDGEGGSGESEGGSSGGVTTETVTDFEFIEVKGATKYVPEKIKIPNILSTLKKMITEKTGIKEPHRQLLTNEFCECVIMDMNGNRFPINLSMLNDFEKDTTIVVYGSLGDNNRVHISVEESIPTNKNKKGDEFYPTQNYYLLTNSFLDNTIKNIPVVTDKMTQLMQAKSNSIESQRIALNNGKAILDKQIDLNDKRTDLSQTISNYNAQYGVDNSMIGLGLSSFGVGMSTANFLFNPLQRNLSGASNIAGSLVNYGQSVRAYDNSREQRDFTYKANDLNSQQNALSNMSAKNSYHNQLRSFNASLKDVANTPDTLAQSGSDLSLNIGYNVDDYGIMFYLPHKDVLIKADNYLKVYGSVNDNFKKDLKPYIKHKEKYKFIQCSDIQFKGINIPHADMVALKSVFLTGVRIWKYSDNLESEFLKYDTK